MGLEQWAENGWVKAHQTSADEIRNFLDVAERALADARVERLSPDARVGLAWPAVLALGAAALAATGYRADKVRHHERVVDSFRFTVRLDDATLAWLNRMRRQRNELTYERVGTLTDGAALEQVEKVESVRRQTIQWLEVSYPELMKHTPG